MLGVFILEMALKQGVSKRDRHGTDMTMLGCSQQSLTLLYSGAGYPQGIAAAGVMTLVTESIADLNVVG